jgi:MSHA biogenesis protein MshQ
MRSSNVVINGSVTMTGDIDIGSGGTINGDVVARNVTTHSSNAFINGNAAVNAIYIDWNNGVTKTITCTGPGASAAAA